jgi:hypothetical protein
MLPDSIAGAGGKRANELLEVVTLKEGDTATALTEKQMLMAFTRGDKGLTTFGLMDALDEVQLLQLFQRAINRYQAEGAITFAGRVIDLDRSQRVSAASDSLYDSPTGRGETIAIFRELGKPQINGHGGGDLRFLIEIGCYAWVKEDRRWAPI